MRFLHIADLHFGKSMNEVSLIEEDQPHWVEKFLEIVDETKSDAVVIAGDVYDRSSPSGDAVSLLDYMLTQLAERKIPVLMVAGNHDSGQKLSFAGDILKNNGIYISGVLSADKAEIPHVTLKDSFGDITFWLMPYIFPALVNEITGADYRDYDAACRGLIAAQDIDPGCRNVMVAHQNVVRNGAEAERGGSESMVAGVGGIEYTAFEKFEYTALGHIHAAQQVGSPCIRYAGSPLCYHFDETKFAQKGPVLVEINEKGTEIKTEIIPVEPLHNVRVLKGTFDEVTDQILNSEMKNEYLKAVITDRKLSPEISDSLRASALSRGSLVMEISSEAQSSSSGNGISASGILTGKQSVSDLFREFFTDRKNGTEPDENDMDIISLVQEYADISDTDSISDRIIELAERQEAKK